MISLPREFCLEAREGGKLTPGPPALTSPGWGGAVSQASYSPKASSLDFRNPLKIITTQKPALVLFCKKKKKKKKFLLIYLAVLVFAALLGVAPVEVSGASLPVVPGFSLQWLLWPWLPGSRAQAQ